LALSLENEFVVVSSLEETWKVLLDLPRVGSCLPGASIEPGEGEGTLIGTMRVKLGPMTMRYSGIAEIEEVDPHHHVAVFRVHGQELRGQGTASARIRNTLSQVEAGTRVTVQTELNVTGRPAQFGRGIMQGVAASLLDQFADCLSQTMSDSGDDSSRYRASEYAEGQATEATAGSRAPALPLTRVLTDMLRQQLTSLRPLQQLRQLLTKTRKRK
jgi:carbon monoxide dehydrogenase subunit G